MIDVRDKKNCCGCTACENACPRKCITMEEDEEGFLYPKIDVSRCVDCGLCEKICPVNGARSLAQRDLRTFVVRDKRMDIVKSSTSGGVFTSIMEYILSQNGVIYGVILDEDMVAKHIRLEDTNDTRFKRIPGSKYVRSEIRGIYQQVKQDLDNARIVCFSGTPCQVAGLKSFLRNDYKTLLTVDVVCHGNPSPLYWKKYVEYQERQYKSRIVDAKFRSKTYGYHSGSMRLLFANGKKYVGSVRVNLYLKAFFKDLCSRPSCYHCAFKHAHRVSDLTVYDSWHAGKLAGIKDDDKGYTNVIVQSEKGQMLFDAVCNTLDIYEVDTEQAIAMDGCMVRSSVPWNPGREKFLKELNDTDNLKKYCKNFYKISLTDRIIESLKKYIYFFK